jgi:predicted DNA binding CopG/RHH family protein
MRKEYDFTNMKGRRNPYARRLKRPVTLRLSQEAIDYFKRMAKVKGIPYQSLIDLYLRDCAASGRQLTMTWN